MVVDEQGRPSALHLPFPSALTEYQLQGSSTLLPGDWQPMSEMVTGEGGALTFPIDQTEESELFHRLMMRPRN